MFYYGLLGQCAKRIRAQSKQRIDQALLMEQAQLLGVQAMAAIYLPHSDIARMKRRNNAVKSARLLEQKYFDKGDTDFNRAVERHWLKMRIRFLR